MHFANIEGAIPCMYMCRLQEADWCFYKGFTVYTRKMQNMSPIPKLIHCVEALSGNTPPT
jgi:hypothetical protein